MGNAIKFTEQGEIVVRLSLGEADREGLQLIFAIEDTGVGIAADQLPRVFESFYQVDGSMNRARGGSGLGLAISKQLVELMGGTIAVESERGRGSHFTFAARVERAVETTGIAPIRPHIARPLRALLVDRHPTSAQILSSYLNSWGIAAVVVSSLAEGAVRWNESSSAGPRFDVVILDAKGLGAPAIEFAKTVRSAAPNRRPEIILLVALDGYLADNGLDGLEVAAVLPKPIRPSDLFNSLATIAAGGGCCRSKPSSMRRGAEEALPKFNARILVAEDNPINQEVAAGILESMDCQILPAPSGQAAVDLYAREKFDLILMDCEMPIMDGIEAARRIREIEKTAASGLQNGHRLPIVALTAHALGDVRDKCLQAGMDDFLVKPFDDRQMAEMLSRWLKPRAGAEQSGNRAPTTADAKNGASPVIDEAVIDRIRVLDRKGGRSRLERAVSQFVSIAPSLVETIHNKSREGDTEALWRAAHSLKSSAGALGAVVLSQHCAEIEATARISGIDPVRELVETLDADLADAIQHLQSLIGVNCELMQHEQ